MAGTFTYTYDPTNVPRDAVRLTLQDTDEDDVLLWDEEIAYYLAEYDNNVLKASLAGAKSILAKFARMATRERSGKYEVYFTGKISDYEALIDSIQDQINAKKGVTISYGGVDIDEVHQVRRDRSRVHNKFYTDKLLSEYIISPEID